MQTFLTDRLTITYRVTSAQNLQKNHKLILFKPVLMRICITNEKSKVRKSTLCTIIEVLFRSNKRLLPLVILAVGPGCISVKTFSISVCPMCYLQINIYCISIDF